MLRPLALALRPAALSALGLALLVAGCADGVVPAPPPAADLAWAAGASGGSPVPTPAATQAPEVAPPQAPAPHRTVSPTSLASVDTTAQPGAGLFEFVGVYRGGQAPASDGERWLGLYPTRTGWELASVTVRARTTPDPILSRPDAPEDPPTGVEITTDRTTRQGGGGSGDRLQDDGRVFVRADALSPGPVAVAFAGAWALTAGEGLTVTLGHEPARLEVRYVDGRPGESVLTLDGTPVVHLYDRDAGRPTLFWAGDLDRDGALDWVLDASPHYHYHYHY